MLQPPLRPALQPLRLLRSPLHLPPFSSGAAVVTPITALAGTATTAVAANYTPTMPTGWAVGDLLVLVIDSPNANGLGTELNAQLGWLGLPRSPQFHGSNNAVGATRLQVYWKFAASGQTAPPMNDNGDHQLTQMFAFRGVHPTTPFGASAGSATATTATSITLSGITTTADGAYVLLMATHGTDTATPEASGITNAALTGLTVLSNQSTLSGVGGGLVVAGGIKTTAGATGTTAMTLATASGHSQITLALRPNSAPALNGTAIAANTSLAEGAAFTLLRPQVVRYGSANANAISPVAAVSATNFFSATFPPGDYIVGNGLFDAGDPWGFNTKQATIDPT